MITKISQNLDENGRPPRKNTKTRNLHEKSRGLTKTKFDQGQVDWDLPEVGRRSKHGGILSLSLGFSEFSMGRAVNTSRNKELNKYTMRWGWWPESWPYMTLPYVGNCWNMLELTDLVRRSKLQPDAAKHLRPVLPWSFWPGSNAMPRQATTWDTEKLRKRTSHVLFHHADCKLIPVNII